MPDQSDRRRYPRQKFLENAAIGFAAATAGTSVARPFEASAASIEDLFHYGPASANAAYRQLLAGNARFASDRSTGGPYAQRRQSLEKSQSPFAVILGCADSRVPLATVFDAMPGDIFGVRVAGNFVDNTVLGSVEYAVAVLKAPLIMVLGHTGCGAVSAAVDYVKSGTTTPGHIQGIVEAIAPAARESRAQTGDWKHNATIQNVKDNAGALAVRSTILSEAINADQLAIVGCLYDLASGRVSRYELLSGKTSVKFHSAP